MKLSLFLRPQAEADIDNAIDFIAKHNPEKALAFDRAVFESFDLLCIMAKIGTPYPTSNRKLNGLRMWFVKGFEKYLSSIFLTETTWKYSEYSIRRKTETRSCWN